MSQRVTEELGEGEHVQLGGPGQASFRRRHSGRAVVDKKGRFQNRVSNPSSRLWIVDTASLHSSQSDVLPTPPPLDQPLTAPHRDSKETRGTLLSHPACLQQLWTNLQPAVPLPPPNWETLLAPLLSLEGLPPPSGLSRDRSLQSFLPALGCVCIALCEL